MIHLVLSVGSNCSDREVEKALVWLKGNLDKFKSSRLYTTPPVQGRGKPYVNAVAEGFADIDIDKFNILLKEFEKDAGRNELCRQKGIVPIDIDIVKCDDQILRPKDYLQKFFQIGYLELTGSIVENQPYK